MYGLLVESVVDFTKRKYGPAIWEKVRVKAKIDNHTFSTHQQYSETLLMKLIKALADVTNTSVNEILETLGADFVGFVSNYGYDRILKVLGRHMRDFLNGLDNLHEYMRFSYPKLKPPSFFVEKESAEGIRLHYRSRRKGYTYYVKGQLKQVGKTFYNTDIDIKIISEAIEGDLSHVVFDLRFKNLAFKQVENSNTSLNRNSPKPTSFNLAVKSEIFFELFPFHVVFNRNMNVVSIGSGLAQALKNTEGESMSDLFNLIRPLIPLTWEMIIGHTNNVFEMSSIEPVQRVESTLGNDKETSMYNTTMSTDSSHEEHLKLKGQMMFVREWECIIFLATPVLENLDVMFSTGFYINDLSMHDSSRDLVLVGTQQSAELKLALDQERQKSKALEDSMKKLDVEMKRTDQLLYQMIPKKIADRLRAGEPAMNLCEVVPSCTILFSDVVGFTQTCAALNPMEVVAMLNGMYTRFDKSLESHNVYKVETIGDAYMVVSGLPERNNNHATEIIDMAFDMLNNISTLINPATNEPLKIRIGVHTGSVVAGVVGLKMPRYCLFGDTVNVANRMESSSEAMRIHISEITKNAVPALKYRIQERGKIEVKGQGELKTHFVLAKVDDDGKSIKASFMDAYNKPGVMVPVRPAANDNLLSKNESTPAAAAASPKLQLPSATNTVKLPPIDNSSVKTPSSIEVNVNSKTDDGKLKPSPAVVATPKPEQTPKPKPAEYAPAPKPVHAPKPKPAEPVPTPKPAPAAPLPPKQVTPIPNSVNVQNLKESSNVPNKYTVSEMPLPKLNDHFDDFDQEMNDDLNEPYQPGGYQQPKPSSLPFNNYNNNYNKNNFNPPNLNYSYQGNSFNNNQQQQQQTYNNQDPVAKSFFKSITCQVL